MCLTDFPLDIAGIFFPIGIYKSWNKFCMGNNSMIVRIFSNDSTLITSFEQFGVLGMLKVPHAGRGAAQVGKPW